MVARSPQRRNNKLPLLDPLLIRETLNKVDRCMVRLQELQFTAAGGTKHVSGVTLSPRSTRTYLRTSLKCKQESLRIKNKSAQKTSPIGKFPKPANSGGEWRQMSLPAMLVGETVIEILQASKFAREIVSKVDTKTTTEDPKTPLHKRSNQKFDTEFNTNTQLRAKRKKEKQNKQQDSDSPPQVPLQRARSRINFKVSPPKVRNFDKEKENNKYLANRVSPRNRPWATKTVLFPNPLFSSASSSHQQQFCKTRSPVISRNRGTTTSTTTTKTTPHKFVIMSPQPKGSKFQVKVKTPPLVVSSISSPVRPRLSSPPKRTKLSRHFSPCKVAVTQSKSKKTVQKSDGLMCLSKSSPKRSAASKLRRSFSPSRLVTRLVSPLKGKKTVQKSDDGLVTGLKQRPTSTMHLPAPRFKNIL